VPARRRPEIREGGHKPNGKHVLARSLESVESRAEVVELALEHGPVDVQRA
jgi:hypothetical protein